MLFGVGDRAARVIGLAAFTLMATATSSEAQPRRRVVDGIVAIVDDTCITRSELARFVASHEARLARELLEDPAKRVEATARLRNEGVRALIDERLFQKEAARRNVEVTDGEVAAALATVAAQNNLSVPQLFAAAMAEGLDEVRYRAALKSQILEAKIIQAELARAKPDWKGLTENQRSMEAAMVREALLATLREGAFIDIRL